MSCFLLNIDPLPPHRPTNGTTLDPSLLWLYNTFIEQTYFEHLKEHQSFVHYIIPPRVRKEDLKFFDLSGTGRDREDTNLIDLFL
jgi:hypothetical protein